MSAFSELDHHQINNIVAQNVWFIGVRSVLIYFSSWSEEYAATSEDFDTQSSSFPAFIQSMSLYIDMKMIRSLIFQTDFDFPPSFVGFSEVTAMLCVLVNFPLEQDWDSINTIQFTIFKTSIYRCIHSFFAETMCNIQRKRIPLLSTT